jgi:hypothetical protein
MLQVREELLDDKTRRLRAARLAKEELERQRLRHQTIQTGSVADFWSLVDTYDPAPAACHKWLGFVNRSWADYEFGEFKLAEGDCVTTLVHRIAIYIAFGREVARQHDVVPTCGNRLCCNVLHLRVNGETHGQQPADYFACTAATD